MLLNGFQTNPEQTTYSFSTKPKHSPLQQKALSLWTTPFPATRSKMDHKSKPIPSMGLVYLPTNLPNKNQPLIYRSSHGPHGIGTRSPPCFWIHPALLGWKNPPIGCWIVAFLKGWGWDSRLRLGFQVKVGIPCLKIEDVILGGCCDYCDCHPGVGEGEPKTLHLNFHHSFRSQGYPWWWRNSSKEFFFFTVDPCKCHQRRCGPQQTNLGGIPVDVLANRTNLRVFVQRFLSCYWGDSKSAFQRA